MNSFRDVIQAFGGASAFAKAVGANLYTARSWLQRDTIPANWWVRVVEAGAVNGVTGISSDLLATIAHETERKTDAA